MLGLEGLLKQALVAVGYPAEDWQVMSLATPYLSNGLLLTGCYFQPARYQHQAIKPSQSVTYKEEVE